MKSRDAVRQKELRELQTALNMYYLQEGKYPANPTPGSQVTSGSAGWDTVFQLLVNAKVLGAIPKGPTGTDYMYYNYGAGSAAGAILVTRLETMQATTVAPAGTCRPFTANWCSYTQASKDWCLCNTY